MRECGCAGGDGDSGGGGGWLTHRLCGIPAHAHAVDVLTPRNVAMHGHGGVVERDGAGAREKVRFEEATIKEGVLEGLAPVRDREVEGAEPCLAGDPPTFAKERSAWNLMLRVARVVCG